MPSPENTSLRTQESQAVFNGVSVFPPSKKQGIPIATLEAEYPLRYQAWSYLNGKPDFLHLQPDTLAKRLQMLNNLDRYITAHMAGGRTRVLREKQMAVFKDTRDFLEGGSTEGFVEAPTGFGKTVLFSELIKATNEKTLVVVPSRLLVEQTYQRLKQFNPTMNIGRFYSDIKERDRQVTITTYNSLVLSNGGVKPEGIDLLVLDEVHQSLTNIRIEAARRFTGSIKLGFTATPEFTEDKRVQDLLNNEIHTISLKEAVETGLLSSFSVYLAQTDVDISKVRVTQSGEYDVNELEEAINIYSRNKSAVDMYQQLIAQNPDLVKAVAYCVNVKHAREVARMYNEARIPAAAVWSDQDPKERQATMQAYRNGDIKVLTNVNILTEGFDDPEASLCFNLRPTLSRVVAKQRGGRVLRLDPEKPHKHAIIIDYLDKNEDKRNMQITFAQVAEGAQILNTAFIDPRTGLVGNNGDKGGDTGVVDTSRPFDIDGLKVITNSEEVLRIVRELEADQIARVPQLKAGDIAITQDFLGRVFIGNQAALQKVATGILNEMLGENSESVYDRRIGRYIVKSITNYSEFVEKMTAKDIQLRPEIAPGIIQSGEISLTERAIMNIFIGTATKLMPIAEEVVKEMREQNPASIVLRKSGIHYVTAIIDANNFKERMQIKDVRLRPQEEIVTAEENVADSFIVKNESLDEKFIGRSKFLRKASQEAIRLMQMENPNSVKWIKSGVHLLPLVGWPQFLGKMEDQGVKIRDMSIESLKDGEIGITIELLRKYFVDGGNKTLVSAQVIEEIRTEHPDSIKIREVAGGKLVTVVSDIEKYFRKMQDKGLKLRVPKTDN